MGVADYFNADLPTLQQMDAERAGQAIEKGKTRLEETTASIGVGVWCIQKQGDGSIVSIGHKSMRRLKTGDGETLRNGRRTSKPIVNVDNANGNGQRS